MSTLTEQQTIQMMDIIYEQHKVHNSLSPLADNRMRLLAERMHLILNPDVQLPVTDTPVVAGWLALQSGTNIPFWAVSGGNIGGLPDGSVLEPNGHLMELVTQDQKQILRAICEHDYLAHD